METWIQLKGEEAYSISIGKSNLIFGYGRNNSGNRIYILALNGKNNNEIAKVTWNLDRDNYNNVDKKDAQKLLKYEHYFRKRGLPAKQEHILADLFAHFLEDVIESPVLEKREESPSLEELSITASIY